MSNSSSEVFGTSFFDLICCALGGGLLLMLVLASLVKSGGSQQSTSDNTNIDNFRSSSHNEYLKIVIHCPVDTLQVDMESMQLNQYRLATSQPKDLLGDGLTSFDPKDNSIRQEYVLSGEVLGNARNSFPVQILIDSSYVLPNWLNSLDSFKKVVRMNLIGIDGQDSTTGQFREFVNYSFLDDDNTDLLNARKAIESAFINLEKPSLFEEAIIEILAYLTSGKNEIYATEKEVRDLQSEKPEKMFEELNKINSDLFDKVKNRRKEIQNKKGGKKLNYCSYACHLGARNLLYSNDMTPKGLLKDVKRRRGPLDDFDFSDTRSTTNIIIDMLRARGSKNAECSLSTFTEYQHYKNIIVPFEHVIEIESNGTIKVDKNRI